jgi:hypothetical protein
VTGRGHHQPRRTGRTQIDEPPLCGSEAQNWSAAKKEKERHAFKAANEVLKEMGKVD